MDSTNHLPTSQEIKAQLLPITAMEKASVIAIPLLTILTYFISAYFQWYLLSFFALCYLSFVSYGSCCHDLVHANFGLTRKTCNIWLSFIEFFLMRSGTTYRFTHLNHHQYYPDFEKDIEGRASYFSLARTLLEGPVFHLRLVFWTLKNGNREIKIWVYIELIFIIAFWFLGIVSIRIFPILFVYQITVTLGSWVIPFITSYLVHNPHERMVIKQTKIFRGKFFRIIALDHLYHLEHHLYPQIPHFRWPQMAKILNPYFKKANLAVIRFESTKSQNFELN